MNEVICPFWEALCWLTQPQICLKYNNFHIFKQLTFFFFFNKNYRCILQLQELIPQNCLFGADTLI